MCFELIFQLRLEIALFVFGFYSAEYISVVDLLINFRCYFYSATADCISVIDIVD